ncbi:MAG: phytanoyl-CoA dioxygenase family protein [Planctomycetota bacterium]|nr:phytanoyl-CoA dioxygenase family protein [Planctomycetota bacterium]
MNGLTEGQKRFFEDFGFLKLPGFLKNEIGWITEEFEAVFRDRKTMHVGTQRSCIVPFIDQREKLCTLLDHPGLHAVLCDLLGDDFNYLAGDGNFYTGDTGWHPDGCHRRGLYLKAAFYLDELNAETGALRVIPCTHRLDAFEPSRVRTAGNCREHWGIEQREVPFVALDITPGDLVIFNHNLMHASVGGGKRRRMFTMNCGKHASTPEEIQDLEQYIAGHSRFWLDSSYSDVMKRTASPQRMRHLAQVLEHEKGLPELSAKARAGMAEPSRG